MPTTTETKTERRAYAAYGRVFRVEQLSKSWMYCAIGRGRGRKSMYLDKLGCHAAPEPMQTALDKWAERYGFKAVGQGTEATPCI